MGGFERHVQSVESCRHSRAIRHGRQVFLRTGSRPDRNAPLRSEGWLIERVRLLELSNVIAIAMYFHWSLPARVAVAVHSRHAVHASRWIPVRRSRFALRGAAFRELPWRQHEESSPYWRFPSDGFGRLRRRRRGELAPRRYRRSDGW